MILPPFAKLGLLCIAEHRDEIWDARAKAGRGVEEKGEGSCFVR
jgi:hypothetical protein